ncbi:ankyrin repeat-containing domain protein [Baffinella frigidus]|nr:ankyrin repeat-containing domain protein [Cryptophyta sp. CCMP2293]
MSRSPPVLRPVRWTAAAEGWVEDLQRLLADGAEDVDERGGPTQCTPLQIAAQQGHRAVALLLLEAGADVSATDSIGASPIHYAAQEGHEDVSFLLILRGAEVRAKTDGGSTAMHYAAQEGHAAVVQLLLDKGSDVQSRTHSGKAPERAATARGHLQIALILKAEARRWAQC